MIINDIKISRNFIDLKKGFKTALRSLSKAEVLYVKVYTDDGICGLGSASPTAVITGDTEGSIIDAVDNYIKPAITGMNIEDFDEILKRVDKSLVRNSSAKAAVDIAIYDLYGKHFNIPVYKLLGGAEGKIMSDITISINSPEEMSEDAESYYQQGYRVFKLKVGDDINKDIKRIKAVKESIGNDSLIRIDANQAWQPKQAVKLIHMIEDSGIDVEFVEQPVAAYDIDGLKYVTDHVEMPVMADESLFDVRDALMLLNKHAVDLLNIKLMKCGGIHNAVKINSIAECYGVKCMIGCMIESRIGIAAAASIAAAKKNIAFYDLDASELLYDEPINTDTVFQNGLIKLSDKSGFGIRA